MFRITDPFVSKFQLSSWWFKVNLKKLEVVLHYHQYHQQENSPRAWCYHHLDWQLAACSYLYFSKHSSSHCGPTAESLSYLTIKLFSTRHLARLCGFSSVVLEFWSRGFFSRFMAMLHCGRSAWCSNSFLFMAGFLTVWVFFQIVAKLGHTWITFTYVQ